MDWDLKDYDEKCDTIREENEKYLDIFEKDLAGLSPKTVRKHLGNVDLFINDYLLLEDVIRMDEGIDQIDDFLGDFFIRKCMWSTPATIKSTAASIKKFYKSMKEHSFIEAEDYDRLCSTIKENMDDWQRVCAVYNDIDEVNPFAIW